MGGLGRARGDDRRGGGRQGRDGAVGGTIPNRREAIGRAIKKLQSGGKLRVCYEAGSCGYGLYWQLAEMGTECDVVAPTLIPVKTGDRVKTDRRDAEKLARLLRSGDLTAVWVPDAEQQALRDLVRARHAAKRDQLRHRNRLGKFLLQLDVGRPEEVAAWGTKHMAWLDAQKMDHASHQEVFVDYLNEDVKASAWKVQHRLHARFQKLSAKGKHHGRVVTAISRELLGFVWAIACKVGAQLHAAA